MTRPLQYGFPLLPTHWADCLFQVVSLKRQLSQAKLEYQLPSVRALRENLSFGMNVVHALFGGCYLGRYIGLLVIRISCCLLVMVLHAHTFCPSIFHYVISELNPVPFLKSHNNLALIFAYFYVEQMCMM